MKPSYQPLIEVLKAAQRESDPPADELGYIIIAVQSAFDAVQGGYMDGHLSQLQESCTLLCQLEPRIPGCFDTAIVLAQAISALRLKADHAVARNLLVALQYLHRLHAGRAEEVATDLAG